jgi:hypothetical protein
VLLRYYAGIYSQVASDFDFSRYLRMDILAIFIYMLYIAAVLIWIDNNFGEKNSGCDLMLVINQSENL